MKPITLKMNAFAAYGGEETIDFTKLKDNNIFLISGPTGGGKTTVFDAICFALYGKGSCSERDGKSLVSDFADEGEETYVELTFSLHDKTYYIRRTPAQSVKSKRGDKLVKKDGTAELKIIETDKIYSGLTEVNNAVQEIFGLTYDQFVKIVMIPQGEFKKFLEADVKEKEEIFRRIFKTYDYERIQNILEEESKVLKGKLQDVNLTKRSLVRGFVFDEEKKEEIEKLENGSYEYIEEVALESIKKDESLLKDLLDEILKLESEEGIKAKEKLKCEESNKRVLELKEFKEKVASLAGEEEKVNGEEEFIKNSKNALIVWSKEDALEECNRKKEKEVERVKTLDREIMLGQEELSEVLKKYEEFKDFNDKINKLNSEKVLLQGKLVNFEKLKEVQKDLNNIISEKNLSKNELERLNRELENIKVKKDDFNKELSKEPFNLKEKSSLEKSLIGTQNIKDIILEGQKRSLERESIVKKFNDVVTNFNKVHEEYMNKSKLLETMRNEFFKAQAGILALDLKDGVPCPVCGSIEHPSKAILVKDTPKEDDIKTLEVEVNQLLELKNKWIAKKESIISEGKSKKEEIEGIMKKLISYKAVEENYDIRVVSSYLDKILLNFQEKIKEDNKNLSSIEIKLKDIECKKSELIKIEKREKELEESIKNINKKLEELILKEGNEQGKYGELKSSVGEEDEVEVLKKVRALSFEMNKLNSEKEMIEEKKKNIENKLIQYKKEFDLKNEMVKDLQKDEEKLKEEMDKLLKEYSFNSIEDYKQFKISLSEIKEREKEVKEFKDKIYSLKEKVKYLEENYGEETLKDVSKLEEKLKAILEEKKEKENRRANIDFKVKNNKGTLKKLNEICNKFADVERQYAIMDGLSTVSRGMGDNLEKISFERYVMASYFDEVIDAANLRLRKMTYNRYELVRIIEKQNNRSQQGLDLNVFDNYTGKERNVKTLSGGESFKASLSLALGLADIVQGYSGGISLQTMFIDEGFGTLDPQSLDSAISVLEELQESGRLVGIISHVQDLKERMRAILRVIPGTKGSTTEFIIR